MARLCILTALVFVAPVVGQDGNAELRGKALKAMRLATKFYTDKVAVGGGYVYYYSTDLRRRLGEGVASPSQIWVQPPGTPTVGMAFVRAYQATGERQFLEAAKAAAKALVYGQLKSGGWTNSVDFEAGSKRVAAYRNGKGGGKNNSTLDDGITQSALRCLMQVDQVLNFQDREIHEAASLAGQSLLSAQFPNGAFPQVWTRAVDRQPVLSASYPEYDWRKEGRIKNYWDMYTLNDGLAGDVAEALIDGHRIYKDKRYLAALKRLGDFLIKAQMPDPQPAWAQQYNYQMQPIWARRFEPPAIAGRESQDAMETLLRIHEVTADAQLLPPVERALRYLKRSKLSDGRLPRYYELRSNRPLYMQRSGKAYTLTYDDSRLPAHYGWKVASRLDAIEGRLRAAKTSQPKKELASPSSLERQVRAVIGELDQQGRWITIYFGERLVGQPKLRAGEQFISSATFSHNLELLSRFLRN